MRHDSDGRRLPINLDSTSNGEVAPMPLERVHLRANALAHQAADANAKRLGLSRRRLLVSAAGAAGTLLAFNQAYAAAGRTGGFYEIEQTAAIDVEQAAQRLGSREFIFDVQGRRENEYLPIAEAAAVPTRWSASRPRPSASRTPSVAWPS